MKKKFTLILLVLSIHLGGQIPTIGLIGGWPFTGNANDMSSSGNHGTVNGATLTQDRFSTPNCAYSFNGLTDYIVMLAAGPTGTVSRSVSFWAKSNNAAIQVAFDYGGSGGAFEILCNYNCAGVGFDNSLAAVIWGNNTLSNNNWHHIVAVLNSSTGIQVGDVDLYVDAVLQTNLSCFVTSTTSLINSNNAFPIRIGRSSNSSTRFFNGCLDDFYFYNRPLSLTEIQILYNDVPCASPSNPGPITGDISGCMGSGKTYSIAPVNGATSYSWTLPSGWSGVSSINIINVFTNATSGPVSVVATNSCGQSIPSNLNVTIYLKPTISIAGPENPSCTGQNINLAANGALTYTWQPGNLTGFFVTFSPTTTTNYTITGTDGNTCVNSTVYTQSVMVCNSLKKEKNAANEILIYPNPSQSNTIYISGINQGSKIEIYSTEGKIIMIKKLGADNSINTSELNPGIYFLRIYNEDVVVAKKIIKEE